MHRFSPSRSRVLFEVFCALAISASLVGAWMQTGASALLPAAAISALYGLIHAFDLAGRGASVVEELPRSDFATDDQRDLPARDVAVAPFTATDQQLEAVRGIEEAEFAAPAALQETGNRRTRAPRKGGGRRAKANKAAKGVDLALPKDVKVIELAPPEEAEGVLPLPSDETGYMHIEPLFEPEPFARQQRMMFGRKAR